MTARLVGVGGRQGAAPDAERAPVDGSEVPYEALLALARREPVRAGEVARAHRLLTDPGWCHAEQVAQALIEQTVEVVRFWRSQPRPDGTSAYTGP